MTNEDLDYLAAYGASFTAIPIQRLLSGDKRSAGNLFTAVADTSTKKLLIQNNTSDHVLADGSGVGPDLHAEGEESERGYGWGGGNARQSEDGRRDALVGDGDDGGDE